MYSSDQSNRRLFGRGKHKRMRNQAFSIPFKLSKVTPALNALPTEEPVFRHPGL